MNSIPPNAKSAADLLRDVADADLPEMMCLSLTGERAPGIPGTPEILARALKAAVAHPVVGPFWRKVVELQALITSPAGTMDAEDQIKEFNRIVDELTDLGLEVPEPPRTRLLKDLLPIRDKARTLRSGTAAQ